MRTMTDGQIEQFRQQALDRQIAGARRRREQAELFEEAAALARDHGLLLLQHTEVHYSLQRASEPRWRIEVYPGNQRLYKPPHSPGPFLPVRQYAEDEWTLLHVVKCAIDHWIRKENRHGRPARVPGRAE